MFSQASPTTCSLLLLLDKQVGVSRDNSADKAWLLSHIFDSITFAGVITGTGNCFPKLMVKLYETSAAAIKTGDLKLWAEAQRLQLIGEPE